MHRVVDRISSEDLIQACLHRDPLAGWTNCHVNQGEHVQLIQVGLRELGELGNETPFLCLKRSARVIGDQRHDPLRNPLTTKPSGTVDGMEPGLS